MHVKLYYKNDYYIFIIIILAKDNVKLWIKNRNVPSSYRIAMLDISLV